MLSEWVRIYKTLHTWTGIIAGMALFIAFYAGALTVFKDPVSRWASPPASAINTVPLGDTKSLIDQTLSTHPQVADEFFIHLNMTENAPARLHWNESEAGADEHDQLSQRTYVAGFNTDGSVIVEEIQPSQLAEFIDVLHRVVGLPFDTEYNRWIMGVFAILYSLALLSGLIVLLPTLAKDFFAMRLGKNLKRMWLDVHNIVGVMSLPFHLIIALTAVGFAYHDGIYAVQDKIVHQGTLGQALRSGMPTPDPSPKDPATLLPPETIVAKAKTLSAHFEPDLLQYIGITGPMPMIRVWGEDPEGMGARAWGSFAVINPYTGEVINTDYLPSQQAGAFTAINTIFSLHFVTFGGITEKWVYFLLALSGAWLFYSGNLLWVETRRRKQRNNATMPAQRRDTQYLANASIGVCLGCICGISLTVAAAKWISGWVTDLTFWHQVIYYSTFFSCIIWSFFRGAARAAVNLLWLACVGTAAIPVTTLLAWLLPVLGLWGHSSTATLGVDIAAAAGALCFAVMAKQTARRAQQGAPDSIWSESNNNSDAAVSAPAS